MVKQASLTLMMSLLTALPVLALPEAQVTGELVDRAYASGFARKGSTWHTVAHPIHTGTVTIGYHRFASPTLGDRGCVVISPGAKEPSLKYIEVAADLAAAGFGPIYAIDHRGQGFSSRELPDPQKMHINNFNEYVTSFEVFMNSVVRRDSECTKRPMFMLAHSMGGAIAAGYLEKVGARSPFRNAVLIAPMMQILTPGLTEHDVLEHKDAKGCALGYLKPIKGLIALVEPKAKQLDKCYDYVPGGESFRWKEPCTEARATHSVARCQLNRAIIDRFTETQLGDQTVVWLRASIEGGIKIRSKAEAAKITTPVLLLQAGKDLYVVNDGQDEFCANMGPERCQLVAGPFKEAKHELLMEVDAIRDQAMGLVLRFFKE